jgi:hypothetical protein
VIQERQEEDGLMFQDGMRQQTRQNTPGCIWELNTIHDSIQICYRECEIKLEAIIWRNNIKLLNS